ncbi:MAG: hypothetical protein J1G06_03220 [Oscillospiraceae bacterium]|nr:hypothetical protein [Oscillospiraceae bacterium]
MKEEVTAGGKEFGFAMLWAAALYFVCGIIMTLFRSYYFAGGVISILVFCVFGFFVMTRYSARFTYTVKSGRLRVNRMIGKRNKEIELLCKNITNTSYGKRPAAFPKRPYNMRKTVFSTKKLLFIEFTDKEGEKRGVIIQPSEKFIAKIDCERNKND